MFLTYIPRDGFACPGDGWPAADHEETDQELAEAKLASGFYRTTLSPGKRAKAPTSESTGVDEPSE